MTAERMYGYLRLTVLRRPCQEAEGQIARVAAEFGGQVQRVFIEPIPAVDVLWSVFVGADRVSGGHLMPAVTAVADRREVDLRQLCERGRRATAAVAWHALLAEIRRVGGGRVIVPTLAHLDGLAESRSTLLHQLSRMRPAVYVVSALEGTPGVARVDGDPATQVISALVGEFRVGSVEVLAKRVWWYLARAGLSYLVADAEAVLRELIGAGTSSEPFGESGEVRVRLLRTVHRLAIDVHTSRPYAGEPVPEEVRRRCSRVRRQDSATGGTRTWCELPLADPDSAGPVEAVPRRIAVPPVAGGGWR